MSSVTDSPAAAPRTGVAEACLAPVGRAPVFARPAADVLAGLGTGDEGLSTDEARRRLDADGPNELEAGRGPGLPRILARQFHNPLIYTLLLSGAVAIALGKATDGAVVLAVVAVNAAIGCVQEYRAANAIEALRALVVDTASVRRDGCWRTLPARELVRGDVVALAPGDKATADIRLLRVHELRVDESALTGESLPVAKDPRAVAADTQLAERRCMTHAGTIVRAGTAVGVVTAAGAHTEIGRISVMLGEAQDLQTPLTRSLAALAGLITRAVAAVAAALFAIGLARGWAPADATLAAVTLAVAAIPEGLPAIVTIALAVGVRRMAARRAIVRRLPAVETLGSTTIIATDKTGTLTRNEMHVCFVWTPEHRSPVAVTPGGTVELLEAGVLCNDADVREDADGRHPEGDPTEVALLFAAEAGGVDWRALRTRFRRVDVIPFASEAQSMTTLHAGPRGARFALLKGAPEVVLAAAPDAGAATAVATLTATGHRVLAFARADVPPDVDVLAGARLRFRLLGLQAMMDPPRPQAREAVAAVRRAGVRVAMITGDHHATARAVADQVGLRPTDTVTGAELERADPEAFTHIARTVDVFARVAPEHKLRLVRALQDDGEVVAMTGDGVNDAPALEQANIGVAMGRRGTSAAREAADIVLADDDFATLEAAVEEGRRVYDNVVKALWFVLPTNLGEALVLLAAVCFFPFEGGRPLMPIEPVQILWINLVATVTLALPLAFEALERGAMSRPPRRPDARLVDRQTAIRTAVVAAVMAAGAIALFVLERDAAGGEASTARAQTLAVTSIALFQCLYLLACRHPGARTRDVGWLSNPLIYVGIVALIALQAAFVHAPVLQDLFATADLGPREWTLAAGFALLAPVAAWILDRGHHRTDSRAGGARS